jgi:Rod binding domain-containing protein
MSSVSAAGGGSSLSPATMISPASLPAAPIGRGPKAAREFEAQLIGTILESLQKTFADLPGEGSVAGQDNYNYMGNQALAKALAAGGGFGIARLIAPHLEARK